MTMPEQISLRDQFAIAALQMLLGSETSQAQMALFIQQSCRDVPQEEQYRVRDRQFAIRAFQIADAMLTERQRTRHHPQE